MGDLRNFGPFTLKLDDHNILGGKAFEILTILNTMTITKFGSIFFGLQGCPWNKELALFSPPTDVSPEKGTGTFNLL